MSTTDNRTAALPWTAKPAPDSAYEWDIVNADGWCVAEVIHRGPDEGLPVEANAELICRAANSHDALIAAVQLAIDFHRADTQAFVTKYGQGIGTREMCDRLRSVMAMAQGNGDCDATI